MVSDFRPFGRVMPNSAPSMPPQLWPEHMIGRADAEMIDEVVQLVDEKPGRPEVDALVGQQGGFAAAQLIVVDDGAAASGEKLVGIEIIVGGARPAMQDDDRRLVGSRSPVMRYQVS